MPVDDVVYVGDTVLFGDAVSVGGAVSIGDAVTVLVEVFRAFSCPSARTLYDE